MIMLIVILSVLLIIAITAFFILLYSHKELKVENKKLKDSINIQEDSHTELLKKQMDLFMLQEQINPHFLYNTLEAIRSQAVLSDQDEIASATETLGNYFRYCINSHGQPVHLFEELQNIVDYFEIIKFRFFDRISLNISIPDTEILQTYLPRLSLQPLVENAINHGLKDKIKDAVVTISATKTSNVVTLKISDNGCGMNDEQLQELENRIANPVELILGKEKRHGIALPNVHHRIQLMFGNLYGLHIQSVVNEGTDIIIDYPIDYERIIKDQNERIH